MDPELDEFKKQLEQMLYGGPRNPTIIDAEFEVIENGN